MDRQHPRQWEIFETSDTGNLVLVIQSDLLAETGSRVVMQVAARSRAPAMPSQLLPVVMAGDEPLVAIAPSIATLNLGEIGRFVAAAHDARDDVTRALDMVLSGV